MLSHTLQQWGGHDDLWIFGYASLIWRPDFDYEERRTAHVRGWHRALRMWSRINRGTPEQPGLVFALLTGGSCHGMVFRVRQAQVHDVLHTLWAREMPTGVYDPRWLRCETAHGPVSALAFTLSRRSPNYTGSLSPDQYRHIFTHAHGRYGSTHDYARQTYDSLRAHGIRDRALEALLAHAPR
ncbi:MAG: gamma-glutamylcyclotransferase [Curvibacter sp.]